MDFPGPPHPANGSKKLFIITAMEGVDGVFDYDLQGIPEKSPRFEESRRLLTDEINAAVDGLLEGGATEIVVWDGHDSGRSLSVRDIHPKVQLLLGRPVPQPYGLDAPYRAIVFIGQHARAGVENGSSTTPIPLA